MRILLLIFSFCFFGNIPIFCFAEDTMSLLPKDKLLKILPEDHFLGSPEAPIIFIEYSSMTCPHCIIFHNKQLPLLKEKWIDTGKLVFVHRDFPADKASFHGAVLAHCAPKEKYYTFLSILFENIQGWAVKNSYETVENIGKLGGISGQDFKKCIDGKVSDDILETKKQALEVLDVKATPTFFVNNTKYEGLMTDEKLFSILQEILEKNKK